MQKIIRLTALLALLMFSAVLHADDAIMVVANTKQVELSLSKQEVRNLFLGGSVGYTLNAVALPPRHRTRVLFNTKVIGLTEARIQSYWAQMRFSGRKKPPLQLDSTNEVIQFLVQNEGAIAYLPADVDVPEELSVVYVSD